MSKSFREIVAVATLVSILALIGYLTYLGVNQPQIKGKIKIESLTPIPENRTIIAKVKNIGNISVTAEKAYVTFPNGATVLGFIPYMEIKPNETMNLPIDVSAYVSLTLDEPGTYTVELQFSHNAVDKASFKAP